MRNCEALKILSLISLFYVGSVVNAKPLPVGAGTNHTFLPKITGKPETILWKFKGNKVVEWDGSDPPSWYKFTDRGHFDTKTGEFTLQRLTADDSGLYQSEIQVDGELQYSKFDAKVLGPFSEPKVTCKINSRSIILNCTVDPTDEIDWINFEWTGPNDFRYSGENVNISQAASPNSVYYCTASNGVFRKSTQFAVHDCYPDGGNVGVIIGTVIGCIILIILLLLGYKFKDSLKKYIPVKQN